MLASNPVVSDKALALWLCRKEFPQRQKVVKQIKYLLRGGKNKKYIWYMWIDTGVDSESLSHTLVAMGITFIGISSRSPLDSHLDFSGSQSIFGTS